MSDYTAIEKAQDATAFASSRFGKHYIQRLGDVRDNHYRRARTLQRDGSTLAAVAAEIARADEIDGEINYFIQAQEISQNPTLIERIRKNLKRKEDPDSK